MFENPFKKKDGKSSPFAYKRMNPFTGQETAPPSRFEVQVKTVQIETTKKMKTPYTAPAPTQSSPVGSRGGSGSSSTCSDDMGCIDVAGSSRSPIIGGGNGSGATRRR